MRIRFNRILLDKGIVFILTYLSYALLHTNRKAFGNLKPSISEIWTPQPRNESWPSVTPYDVWNTNTTLFDSEKDAALFLGVLDSLFMFSYAFGLYVSGWLGDRLEHRKVLFVGLFGSSVTIFAFGVVTEWTHYYKKYLYCIIWILNGLLQSSVWPSALAVLNSCFISFRGLILGIWSSCAAGGNILGDILIGILIPYGYHYGFMVPSVIMLAFSFMVLLGLVDQHTAYNVPNVESTKISDDSLSKTPATQIPPIPSHVPTKALPFWRILLFPDVICSSLAYACIKLVNYALFFWLTFYLTSNFGWSNSDASTFSAWYDTGCIVGGIAAGLLSDVLSKYVSRHTVNLLFSIAAVFALLGYKYTPPNPTWLNGIVMSLAGLLVGGPTVLTGAVVIGDISMSAELNGARTQATVAGIIDGTGSFGASMGQVLIPYLAFRFGWSSIFYLFIACMMLTCVCLVPLWIRYRNNSAQHTRL